MGDLPARMAHQRVEGSWPQRREIGRATLYGDARPII